MRKEKVMISSSRFLAGLLAASFLAGCAGGSGPELFRGQKANIGAVLAGAASMLAGYAIGGEGSGRTVAMVVGGALGTTGGYLVGAALDRADAEAANAAAAKALNRPAAASAVRWANPETGSHGEAAVVATGTTPDGRECRRMRFAVREGQAGASVGKRHDGEAVFCRTPDNKWRLVPGAEPSAPVS